MAGTDTRAATESDVTADITTPMSQTEGQRRVRTLINELEEQSRSAMREQALDAYWIRLMQEQAGKYSEVLLQMKATLDAVQSWIGDGSEP